MGRQSHNQIEVSGQVKKRRKRRIILSFFLASRFARDKKGATAIEFSMVALPFFAIMFGIFETALVFFAEQMLETGIADATRMIRTGEVQAAGMSETAFKDLVCTNIPGLIDCQGKLKVDVRSFPDFGTITLPALTNADGDLNNNFTFQPGNSTQVVIVRAFYPWTLIVPNHITGLSNASGNTRLLASGAAFRNEPF